MDRHILVTGGCGFIGSHVVRRLVTRYTDLHVVNLDKLTYAGNPENLSDVDKSPNYTFVHGDICDVVTLEGLFSKYDFEGVIHLAAESHVDRSISSPMEFVMTNVVGTVNLLNAARTHWKDDLSRRTFYHVSTDEVFGSLERPEDFFNEETPYNPLSPYSASKASSDHFVRAYGNTYGLKTIISNCSNNYGSHHFPEKLIPLMINNIRERRPLPVYGKGDNVRDWLFVEDHAVAIDLIYHQGRPGETYCIGGMNEWTNLSLVEYLCDLMDRKLGRPAGDSRTLITFVKDRAGHDHRYAIDPTKLTRELGWTPSVTFEQGLEKTVDWYLANSAWMQGVMDQSYRDYYQTQYTQVTAAQGVRP